MESLFFIAIVPPDPVRSEIHALKEEVTERFGSKHALRSPPHITLHMPFKWKVKKEEQLFSLIRELNSGFKPFLIQLKDFDFFEPRVVFVNVEPSESLEQLQQEVIDRCRKNLKLDNGNYKNRPFHPHITIGFRDLKKPQFYAAKKYFGQQSYSGEFQTQEISLLKHDGKVWHEVNLQM